VPGRATQTFTDVQSEGFDLMELEPPQVERSDLPPSLVVALLPIVLVVLFNYVFSSITFPKLDASYLALPRYGSTTIASVKGIWAIICALLVANLFLVAASQRLRANLSVAWTIPWYTWLSDLPTFALRPE
jgi:hypothetical protein